MSTALTERNSTDVGAVNQRNAFEAYADANNTRLLVGSLLKFSKGDYMSGQDNDEVPMGTQLVCNMPELMVGWVKWADGKPEQHIMGRVVDGFQKPKRSTLGDEDQSLWEVDESSNKPRDPWQEANYLIMKPPGANEEDDLYTFVAGSKGGRDAVTDLCKIYGKAMRQRPGELPIIKLGVDKYQHPNKAYGWIKVPTFEVVGWAPASEFDAALQAAAASADARKQAADEKEEIPF